MASWAQWFKLDNFTIHSQYFQQCKIIKIESLSSSCLINFWLFLTKNDDFYLKPKRNSRMAGWIVPLRRIKHEFSWTTSVIFSIIIKKFAKKWQHYYTLSDQRRDCLRIWENTFASEEWQKFTIAEHESVSENRQKKEFSEKNIISFLDVFYVKDCLKFWYSNVVVGVGTTPSKYHQN